MHFMIFVIVVVFAQLCVAEGIISTNPRQSDGENIADLEGRLNMMERRVQEIEQQLISEKQEKENLTRQLGELMHSLADKDTGRLMEQFAQFKGEMKAEVEMCLQFQQQLNTTVNSTGRHQLDELSLQLTMVNAASTVKFRQLKRQLTNERERTLQLGNQLNRKIKHLRSVLNQNGSLLEDMIGLNESRPAFWVRNPKEVLLTQSLKFSSVKANVGSGYDTSTGQFTCDTTGLYLIGYDVSSYWGQLSLDLKRDATVIVRTKGCAGNKCIRSTIVHCNKGNKLYLSRSGLWVGSYVGDSWFAGILLM